MMFIKMSVNECDFRGATYSRMVEGAGAVSRGASGRWCVVMYMGPDALADNPGIVPVTREEAIQQILAENPNDSIDF